MAHVSHRSHTERSPGCCEARRPDWRATAPVTVTKAIFQIEESARSVLPESYLCGISAKYHRGRHRCEQKGRANSDRPEQIAKVMSFPGLDTKRPIRTIGPRGWMVGSPMRFRDDLRCRIRSSTHGSVIDLGRSGAVESITTSMATSVVKREGRVTVERPQESVSAPGGDS